MSIFKKVWYWLVKSSADATQKSLTVKAFLTGLIPGILFFANVMHLQLDNVVLTQIIDGIAQVIVYVGGAITAVAFVIGLIRKVWTTLRGTNDVVTSWRY